MATSPVLTPARAPQFSSRHIPVLDGVRALAILLVIVFHFFQHRPLPGSSLALRLVKLTYLGSNGVDLFFVLSGFLITGILIEARGRRQALRNFYMRRVLRIFPLYYGFLFVIYVLLPLFHLARHVPFGDQWWFWTYCSNIQATFSQRFPDGPGHFWSLAIEEHFYLVWPFLVLRCPPRKLPWVCGSIIIAAIGFRAALQAGGFNPYYFTLCRMDALAFGALLAALIRTPEGPAGLRKWSTRLLLWALPVLAVSYFLLTGSGSGPLQVLKYTFIGVLCSAFIVFAITAKPQAPMSRTLSTRTLGQIGKYSYGMYVLHPAIIAALQERTLQYPVVATLPLAVAATFLAAWCSFTLWEQPFLRLKKLFPSAPAI